jgi:hypothetical protein
MGRACSTIRERRNAYRSMVGKPEGNSPPRRSLCRWEDSIKMNLRYMKWSGMDWINMARIREQWSTLVSTVVNFRVS